MKSFTIINVTPNGEYHSESFYLGIVKDAELEKTKQKFIEAFQYEGFAGIKPTAIMTDSVDGLSVCAYPTLKDAMNGLIHQIMGRVGDELFEVDYEWGWSKYEEYKVQSCGDIYWMSTHKHSSEDAECNINDTTHLIETILQDESLEGHELDILENIQKALDSVDLNDEVYSDLINLQEDLQTIWLKDFSIDFKDDVGFSQNRMIRAFDEDHANDIAEELTLDDSLTASISDVHKHIVVLVKNVDGTKTVDRLHYDTLKALKLEFGIDVDDSIEIGRLAHSFVFSVGVKKLSDTEVTLESGRVCKLNDLFVF